MFISPSRLANQAIIQGSNKGASRIPFDNQVNNTNKALNLTDLKPGDMLFMNDKTSKFTHTAIFAAQLLCKPTSIENASMTHVCMYVGDGKIHEASGAGYIRESNLNDEHGLRYEVLRFKNESYGDDLKKESQKCIEKRNNDNNYGIYSLRGTGGLLRASYHGDSSKRDDDKLLSGEQFKKIQCSAYVGGLAKKVEIKQRGSSLKVMNLHTKHTSPSKLYAHLKSNSEHISSVGSIKIAPKGVNKT